VNGLHLTSTSTASIAARGPDSVIPDNAALGAEIDSDGTDGAITLAGAWTNSILYVRQNTATPAVIATRENDTNKTLRADDALHRRGQGRRHGRRGFRRRVPRAARAGRKRHPAE
jgi:hypothetical protein